MKQHHLNSFLLLLSGLLMAYFLGCSAFSTQPPSPPAETSNSQQLPFSDSKPLVIPADTIISVHLKQPLRAATAEAGQDFTAILDEPLQADGQVVAPQGGEVTGKVVAARETGRLHSAGYVRIRLASISINGKQFPLATNSVIAAAGAVNNRSFSFLGVGNSFQDNGNKKEAGFAANQRLKFRLTQPLSVSATN